MTSFLGQSVDIGFQPQNNSSSNSTSMYRDYVIAESPYYNTMGCMHVHCGSYGQGIVKELNSQTGMARIQLRYGGELSIHMSKIKYHQQHNVFENVETIRNMPLSNQQCQISQLKRGNNAMSNGNDNNNNDSSDESTHMSPTNDMEIDDTSSMSHDFVPTNNNKRQRA